MLLTGKTALVTGATSGIGAETARAFAREGATIVLTGRNSERGEQLLAELDAEAAFIRNELGTAPAADSLVSATLQRFGRLDVLVNNAGVVYHETVPDTSDAQWEETVATNVSAVFYLSRAAVREMIPAGGGVIVNVTSTLGLVAFERTAAYCASKAAVIQLTRAMAVDHAKDNVRINTVCPGSVDTPMLVGEAKAFGISAEEARRSWAAFSANGRLATAEDVADAIVFLASDRAKHIHGTSLVVDGGSSAS